MSSHQVDIAKFNSAKLSDLTIETELLPFENAICTGIVGSAIRLTLAVGIAIEEMGIVRFSNNELQNLQRILSIQGIQSGEISELEIKTALKDAKFFIKMQLQEVTTAEYIRASEIGISRCAVSDDQQLAHDARQLQAEMAAIRTTRNSRALPRKVRLANSKSKRVRFSR